MLECSGMHQACLWARPLEVDGAESRVFTGSAPDGKRGHRPAPCPGPALDAVLDVPTQRLPQRPGERREAHIGRALGRVAPSMLLCSLSEAICFFLGEPGQPLFARPGGGVAGTGCGQPPSLHSSEQTPCPETHPCTPRGPDPHASCENLCSDLRLCGRPRLPAPGVRLRGPAFSGQQEAGGRGGAGPGDLPGPISAGMGGGFTSSQRRIIREWGWVQGQHAGMLPGPQRKVDLGEYDQTCKVQKVEKKKCKGDVDRELEFLRQCKV